MEFIAGGMWHFNASPTRRRGIFRPRLLHDRVRLERGVRVSSDSPRQKQAR